MTLMMSCTCGTSTVMSSWTRPYVIAHNRHDNLVHELHLWQIRRNVFFRSIPAMIAEHHKPADSPKGTRMRCIVTSK